MLSEIITKLNWRILKFLIKREASLSEIARQTKTTKANTSNVLKLLEKYDIVRKNIQGRTHIYRFNFLHSQSKYFIDIFNEEQREEYNKKLTNIPKLMHSFLKNALSDNYKGCIFFGSSLTEKYNDIDILIILKNKENTKEIEKKIKLIEKKLSPIFGTLKDLEQGIKARDMLYKNIINGISFKIDITHLKYKEIFLRKEDIIERFILAYRELLSCLEFKEKHYQKIHLEKGIMDFIYSILNYFDIFPKNDHEAIFLFKKELKESKPKTIKEALSIIKRYLWIL